METHKIPSSITYKSRRISVYTNINPGQDLITFYNTRGTSRKQKYIQIKHREKATMILI